MQPKKLAPFVVILTAFLVLLVSPGLCAAEDKTKVEIQGSIFGGTIYQISYAYSVIGNKYANNLEISTVETTGTAAGILKVYEKPEQRITGASYVSILEAKEGKRPFGKPYPDMRVIGNFTKNIQTFITLDPSIKSIEDLQGKRLGLGPRPTIIGQTMESMIRNGYGISDKMKIYYMKWSQLKDAILDGAIDAMVLGVTTRPSGSWAPVPVFKEISSARENVFFIPISGEAVRKSAVADGITYFEAVLPQNAVSSGQPDKDIPCWTDSLALFAHKDFDAETAYTLTKILYEHCGEMTKTTAIAKGTYPEVITDIRLSDEMIHPGALKYYKEKGIR